MLERRMGLFRCSGALIALLMEQSSPRWTGMHMGLAHEGSPQTSDSGLRPKWCSVISLGRLMAPPAGLSVLCLSSKPTQTALSSSFISPVATRGQQSLMVQRRAG